MAHADTVGKKYDSSDQGQSFNSLSSCLNDDYNAVDGTNRCFYLSVLVSLRAAEPNDPPPVLVRKLLPQRGPPGMNPNSDLHPDNLSSPRALFPRGPLNGTVQLHGQLFGPTRFAPATRDRFFRTLTVVVTITATVNTMPNTTLLSVTEASGTGVVSPTGPATGVAVAAVVSIVVGVVVGVVVVGFSSPQQLW